MSKSAASAAFLIAFTLSSSGCPLGSQPDAVVPSTDFPTLQSAIDALPSGSLVELSEGALLENLVVTDKELTIVGAGRNPSDSVVRARETGLPVIRLAGGARLTLENLRLEGGEAGVEAPFQQVPNVARPVLEALDVQIAGAGRGVVGQFESVRLSGGEIAYNRFNGLSLFGPNGVSVDGTRVHGNRGVGIFIDNRGEPAGTEAQFLLNCTVEDNANGGIDVWGGRLLIGVSRCNVRRNGVYGITFDQARNSLITDSVIEDTTEDPSRPGYWGYGIRVFSSMGTMIRKNRVSRSAGGAMAAYGCDDEASTGPTSAALKDNVITQPSLANLQLVNMRLPECSSPGASWWIDEGGNTCNGGPCRSDSDSVAPIELPDHSG